MLSNRKQLLDRMRDLDRRMQKLGHRSFRTPEHLLRLRGGIAAFLLWGSGIVSLAQAQDFVAVAVPDIAAHVAFSTGASWVDYDGDQDLDLFVVTGFSANRNNVLYRNDGDDTFVSVTDSPLATDGAQNVCSTWADYDNDGATDSFVSGLDVDGSVLYRGLGGGVMQINTTAGLTSISLKGTGCAWGDYDNDGFLDLVVAVLAGVLGMSGGNRLFHNDGDGTFSEVFGDPVVTTPDTHHHPTWSDFDGDSDLDLFFATGPVGSTAVDRLYRNELIETGIASFTPIATGVLATDPRDSQTLSWADYDNDGDLDCYAINYTSVPNQLYRNDGAVFTKITTGSIVTDLGRAHGLAWGDYDNDADLDVYVVRDNAQSNRHYRNNGDGTFTTVTTGPHVTEARSNYGVAAGDYDGDGDLDLFVPTARSEGPSLLFRNDLATGAHWLVVRCVGTTNNRQAIGTKVRVRAVVGGLPRWQMREISASTGYGGQGALDAHFGLGDAAIVDSLLVEWPSGQLDLHLGVGVDQFVSFEQAPISSVDPFEASLALHLQVAPNPFSDHAELRLTCPEAEEATISIFDATGRRVGVWPDNQRLRTEGGPNAGGTVRSVSLDGSRLPGSGVYLVRVSTKSGSVARRVIFLPSR